MYSITTEQSFDAAHFLWGYQGKCGNIHGHRWRVLVEVSSEQLREDRQQRGMCEDFGNLKQDLLEEVEKLDHTFIIETGSLKTQTLQALQDEGFSIVSLEFRPTAENFAKYFYDRMKAHGYAVSRVQVFETPNNCAIYQERE